jgi:hypothetical protein
MYLFGLDIEKGNNTKATTTSLWFNERAFIFTKTSNSLSSGVLMTRVLRSSNPDVPVRIHSFVLTLMLAVVKSQLIIPELVGFILCMRSWMRKIGVSIYYIDNMLGTQHLKLVSKQIPV